jgi:hypothetical protein
MASFFRPLLSAPISTSRHSWRYADRYGHGAQVDQQAGARLTSIVLVDTPDRSRLNAFMGGVTLGTAA